MNWNELVKDYGFACYHVGIVNGEAGERAIVIRDGAKSALLSAILEVEKERDALKEAIENIVNLGVQRLPVDKRWGTAFAIALETEKRLYRPAVPVGQ